MGLDAYLKLDNISGESTDGRHPHWIQVESFSWGVSIPSVRPGTTIGKPQFKSLNVVKHVDVSSPRLMRACATGTRLKICQLEVQQEIEEASQIVYGFFLEDCLVTSVASVTPSKLADRVEEGLGDALLEEVSFTFNRISTHYREFDENGTVVSNTTAGYSYPLGAVFTPPPFLNP